MPQVFAGTVVDIGCGQGDLLVALAAAWPATLVGLDPAPSAVAATRERLRALGLTHRADVRQGNALRTGLPAAVADAVTYRLTLHHVVDLPGALWEAARVLRPGGRIFVEDGEPLAAKAFAAMNAQLARRGHPPEPTPGVDPVALASLLTRAGFVVERVRHVGTMTFATPPYTDRAYEAPRFVLAARLAGR